MQFKSFVNWLLLLPFVNAGTTTKIKKKDDDTLVLLHVLFRHGSRTPNEASLYPNDPYINYTYWPIGYDQLTRKGKKTEFEIGQYIRRNYGNLIPAQYTPNVAYAVSTDVKRTKMSLALVLAGLFPPLPGDIFEPTLNWQPISFNIESGQGIINVASVYCVNYVSAYNKYVSSKEAQEIREPYLSLYAELSNFSGSYIQSPRDASGIYYTLKSEEDYGLLLPSWTQAYYPQILEEASSVEFEYATATSRLRKLSAGFLLKKILEDSFAKQNNSLTDETKVFLYSAHDWNIGTMLRALNVFVRHIPPFGATIYFELHNIKGVYGLRLYYQNYSTKKPLLLTIPGCSSICPLKQMLSLLQDSIPDDNDVCTYTKELI